MAKAKVVDKTDKPKQELPRPLPAQVFALWKAASTDDDRPTLKVVRIEPGSAMATDGHILLKIIPAEKFDIKEPFTVEASMCAQLLRAKNLSGEESIITLSDAGGPISLSVGKYSFSPATQLELFKYEPILEQKITKVGEVGFMVDTLQKLLKSLKALGVDRFRMEFGAETDPVKIEANVEGMDRVTGAVTPARV